MAREGKRIDTGGGQNLTGDNPFAALNLGPLPTAPSPAAQAPAPAPQAAKGRVEIRRLTQGRGGKAVIEIRGLAHLGEKALQGLRRDLQTHCATGGTLKDGAIEIQGERLAEVEAFLSQRGYRVVRTGG